MEEKKNPNLTIISIGIPVVLIITGAIFKIQHWPYANSFLITGALFQAIVHAFGFFIRKHKVATDYLKLIFSFAWCTGIWFRLEHWPFSHVVGVLTDGSFILLIITYAYEYFRPFQEEASGGLISRVLQIAFTGLILTGVFFKIMHLPYGTYLIVTGIICLFAWFVFDWIGEKKE